MLTYIVTYLRDHANALDKLADSLEKCTLDGSFAENDFEGIDDEKNALPDSPPADDPPKRSDAVALCGTLYKAQGMDAVQEVFDQVGVTNATHCPDDQLPALIAALKVAIG